MDDFGEVGKRFGERGKEFGRRRQRFGEGGEGGGGGTLLRRGTAAPPAGCRRHRRARCGSGRDAGAIDARSGGAAANGGQRELLPGRGFGSSIPRCGARKAAPLPYKSTRHGTHVGAHGGPQACGLPRLWVIRASPISPLAPHHILQPFSISTRDAIHLCQTKTPRNSALELAAPFLPQSCSCPIPALKLLLPCSQQAGLAWTGEMGQHPKLAEHPTPEFKKTSWLSVACAALRQTLTGP